MLGFAAPPDGGDSSEAQSDAGGEAGGAPDAVDLDLDDDVGRAKRPRYLQRNGRDTALLVPVDGQGLPDYDESATMLLEQRVLSFLAP